MSEDNNKTISFQVDEKTYQRIENYWHDAHFPSRADALRVLIKSGLADLETKNKSKNGPTEKQVKYVKLICKKKNIAPPSEWSFKTYSEFIDKNKGDI